MCLVRVFNSKVRRPEYTELAGLFFLQSMAMGMWMVPLGRVLSAHGLAEIRAQAFATSAVAALLSPLIFGAMADRHAAPVRVLRWLAAASAAGMALATFSISRGWTPTVVLILIQGYAVCAAPTGSIASSIVFSRLRNSQRQFGPIRAVATIGWMTGCWMISVLGADASPLAGYLGSIGWLSLACFTFSLPSVPPPPSPGIVTWRERLGWDALALLQNPNHRVVFFTIALFNMPLAAFYPFAPQHLKQLGFDRTSALMTLGQVTEVIAMFALAGLFASLRLKWIFAAGLMVGVLRYTLCAINEPVCVLAGITLHGLSFTLVFITAQIYLNERVAPEWRARAQALMWLMSGGIGNLAGYLGSGFWLHASTRGDVTHWAQFWGGLAAVMMLVLAYFMMAYHGQGGGLRRRTPSPEAP